MIKYRSTATLSGVLDKSGTSTPDAGVPVTLLARTASDEVHGDRHDDDRGPTGATASPQSPQSNTLYVVRVTLTASRHTSALL